MKKQFWKQILLWVLVCEAVGALSGFLSRNGLERYLETAVKPPFTPPGIVFAVVWPILYALMGFSIAKIMQKEQSEQKNKAKIIFFAQLFFNFIWSIIFFSFQAYAIALFVLAVLWILILLMIQNFYKLNRTAAWIQVPYLVWVTFAAYLNIGVLILN